MRSWIKMIGSDTKTKLIAAFLLVFVFNAALLTAEEPKRVLNNNMTETYLVLPEKAESFPDVFSKGMVYGRLRTNYFYLENKNGALHDPTGFGLGGGLLYKTAPFYGISTTLGLYTSQNMGLLNKDDALYGRSGKDTFSRYNRLAEGDWGMTVLAQAYVQVNFQKTEIKVGRQIFESFLTASNDTKMIPNTFEGITAVSNSLPDTTVNLGFLTAQKLRDHTEFHDVITYDDGRGKPYSKWNNQDDSVSHRGLSHTNLKAAGEDTNNNLMVAGITNKSVKKLKLDIWYNGVPHLFYAIMAETNYSISLPGKFTLTPGIRYMQQFDRSAGRVGGAALSGTLVNGGATGNGGYSDPDSVDAKLCAARLVLTKGAGKLSAGYSKVFDDGDFIAPWRGFPTGGYTRPMGHYNWLANTQSLMIQISYDFGKAGILEGFRTCVDFTDTNYDDKKERLGGHGLPDVRYVHADMWYVFPFLPGLEAKFRMAFADADRLRNPAVYGTDLSYNEFRFEMNYLF